jgi:hypothetical protein
MRSLLVVVALGLATGFGGRAAAGDLVPGGWLQPVPIPKAAPVPEVPPQPLAAGPAPIRPAPVAHPRIRRPVSRPRHPAERTPPENGQVRF